MVGVISSDDVETDLPGDPVVVHANHYQFAPGQELENPCVGSRMLLWCRQGRGDIEVDGRRHALPPERWLLLPWRHRVLYRADRRDPFLVGGVHIVPDHTRSRPVEPGLPHTAAHPLWRQAYRRDAPWPMPSGGWAGDLGDRPRLRWLAEYAASRFQEARPGEGDARALARLLVRELLTPVIDPVAFPVPLAQALARMRSQLDRPHDLDAAARAAGCSRATLVRLFRSHLRTSPMAWLRAARHDEAARLLASTALPVAEVARRVGIPDPQRFSRDFRTAKGGTPRAFRARARL